MNFYGRKSFIKESVINLISLFNLDYCLYFTSLLSQWAFVESVSDYLYLDLMLLLGMFRVNLAIYTQQVTYIYSYRQYPHQYIE